MEGFLYAFHTTVSPDGIPQPAAVPSVSSYLVLCDDRDRVGARALAALRAGLVHGVELCTTEDLERAAYVQIGRRGSVTSAEIVLRDGRIFTQDNVAGLWNRLSRWPTRLAGREAGAAAALCAWMRGISGPLVGSPSLQSPQHSEAWSRLRWASQAHRAGLPAPLVQRQVGLHVNSLASAPDPGERLSVLVAGDQILCAGPSSPKLPPHIRQACLALGRAVGSGLLEIRLRPSGEHNWEFAEACQRPDPYSHGHGGIQTLIELWEPRPAMDSAGLELEEVR
ncbi:MAG: hypothetical protein ACI8QC_001909 [Planctomycetota bacterium]